MAVKTSETNRRLDKRLPLTGLRLKIRQQGISRFRGYQDCCVIDLSPKGLAFSSNTLDLSELEKIDFILSVENRTIKGSALVCYALANQEQTQYGLIFADASPDIAAILHGNDLTTPEIRALAEKMAEQLVYTIQTKRISELHFIQRQQRLYDALHTYLNRLAEMGVRLPDINTRGEQWTDANKALKIDDKNGLIEFMRYNAETDSMQRASLSIDVGKNNAEIRWQTKEGVCLQSIFDVLGYLGDEISLLVKLERLSP